MTTIEEYHSLVKQQRELIELLMKELREIKRPLQTYTPTSSPYTTCILPKTQ